MVAVRAGPPLPAVVTLATVVRTAPTSWNNSHRIISVEQCSKLYFRKQGLLSELREELPWVQIFEVQNEAQLLANSNGQAGTSEVSE